jgi:hypothetical protein
MAFSLGRKVYRESIECLMNDPDHCRSDKAAVKFAFKEET